MKTGFQHGFSLQSYHTVACDFLMPEKLATSLCLSIWTYFNMAGNEDNTTGNVS